MTDAPRTRLNRILYVAIGLMTTAIFVLAALIIWRVLNPATPEGGANDASRREFTVGTASVVYTVPEGCVDQVSTGPDRITVTFTGDTCAGRQILSLNGDVKLQ